MADLTIAERVANGVAWLDERIPGWPGKIDLPTFDIRSDCDCVIGQVVGDYCDLVDFNAIERPEHERPEYALTLAEAVDLGFDAGARVSPFEHLDSYDDVCAGEFNALQAEWSKAIASRLEVVTPNDQ